MAINRRYKDLDWTVANERGELYGQINGGCSLAVFMDIRDELKALNALLSCPNFVEIPSILRQVRRNTTPKKKSARKAAKR